MIWPRIAPRRSGLTTAAITAMLAVRIAALKTLFRTRPNANTGSEELAPAMTSETHEPAQAALRTATCPNLLIANPHSGDPIAAATPTAVEPERAAQRERGQAREDEAEDGPEQHRAVDDARDGVVEVRLGPDAV